MANPKKNPLCMWVLAWVELAEAIVVILSLGRFFPGWRATVLFSKWIERLKRR